MSRIRATTDARFAFDVLRANQPVLVAFHAERCPTCQALRPALEQLAADRTDIAVRLVDVERNPGTTRRHGVQSVPTLVLFDAGTERARLIGATRRAAIDTALASVHTSVET